MDENAERACEELAYAIYPHYMDDDKRLRVLEALWQFMFEAKKGMMQ